MEKMTQQYSIRPFELVSRSYMPNPARCAITTYQRGGADTVTRINAVGEEKTLVKGDRVHASPFTGTYRECVPISGELSSSYRNTNASGPDKTHCGDTAGTYAKTKVEAGYLYELRDPVAVPSDAALEQRLRDSAETKALANLTQGFYNLGILLAERQKSVSYVKDKALQIARLVKERQLSSLQRYNRTKRKDRHEMARQISNEHLAFMFGLLPMIDEIKGICDLLGSKTSLVITGRGRQAKDQLDLTYQQIRSLQVGSQTGYGAMASQCEFETRTRYSVRSGIVCDLSVESLARLRDHGLNPVATFYDLIPLSFLSDFVSNTGTFLRAFDPLLGYSFRTAYSTLWRERKVFAKVSGSKYVLKGSSSEQSVETTGFAQGYARYLYVQRTPLREMPLPTWLVQNNLSLAKAATIASLAIQRYLKPVQVLIGKRPFRYRGPRPKYLPPIKYR